MTRDKRSWIMSNLDDALKYIQPLREINFVRNDDITKNIEKMEELLRSTLIMVLEYPVEKEEIKQ